MQEAVRNILTEKGYTLSELPLHGEKARCCGFGGQIHAVDRNLMDEIARHRGKASPFDYVTYCTNCRDIFAHEGKPTLHLLDLLFFDDLETRKARRAVSLSASRENRVRLKQLMLKRGGMQEMAETDNKPELNLIIDDELLNKIDRELILKEDAAHVIAYCESSGNKLLDRETGDFVGHLRDGVMTYWVRYRPEGSAFRVGAIYCHRMKIEGDQPGE
jgi:hypothetical protein